MRTTRILRSRERRKAQAKRRDPYKFIAQVVLLVVLLSVTTTTLVLAGGVSGAAAIFGFLTSDLPDFTELERLGQDVETTFETSKIFAWGEDKNLDGQRDLVLIYELIDPLGGDRQWIRIQQIPQDLVNATVSIEDKSFWDNQGFDIEGIGRAFYSYVLQGGQVQGGSSITQQVVKNNLIELERRTIGGEVEFDDYRRKIEEVVLSSRISNVYTKEQIMEWYLNTNFYGNLAYGSEAAARVYYNKTAAQLTLAQSAMLAAIPQSPAFNPIDNPEQAKARQEIVLHAMFREGYITREDMLAALDEDVEVESTLETRFDIISPHFALYVRQELERRFGRDRVLRGGLQVYTTLDLAWQEQAECVARVQVARLSGQTGAELPADELTRCKALGFLNPLKPEDQGKDHSVNNAAVVMIDPRSAEIKAMVGSLNYWDDAIDGRFNVAVDGLRQPGSSFKPFTYLTALTQGYTAASMLLDVETDFGTPYNGEAYVPQNYDRNFNGPMRMRQALANSYNVTAVEVMSWTGVDKVIRLAHEMGITSLDDANDYGLSLTLGGGEVKLIDMAYAFSVFANRGRLIGVPIAEERQSLGFRKLDPVSILRVTDGQGKIIYEYDQPEYEQVVSSQEAFIMASMMSDRPARCAAFGCPNNLELPDQRAGAAKTGTTNDYRDAWTVGFTPQLVTAVWVGNTDNSPMDDVPGSKGAAPIWNALMAWALQEEPKMEFLPPVGVKAVEVCDLNGLLPSQECPKVTEYFVEGTEPTVIDNMHRTFRINGETGRLASASTPIENTYTQTFIVYPDRAQDWARENSKPRPPTSFDSVTGFSADVGNAVILQPEPLEFVSGWVEIAGNARSSQFSYYNLSVFPNADPNNVQGLVGYAGNQVTNLTLGGWNTETVPDGAYTLLLRVFNGDNVVVEEFRTQVTVDNTDPTVEILFPFPNQQVFTDEEFTVIQAQVIDTYAIDQAQFFIDNAGVPFAISTVPPFTEKWNIPGPGCHSFKVKVVDGAGNSAESEPVEVCYFDRDSGNFGDG